MDRALVHLVTLHRQRRFTGFVLNLDATTLATFGYLGVWSQHVMVGFDDKDIGL
jgi:hypothetical protein